MKGTLVVCTHYSTVIAFILHMQVKAIAPHLTVFARRIMDDILIFLALPVLMFSYFHPSLAYFLMSGATVPDWF